jgi:hypothetical protein
MNKKIIIIALILIVVFIALILIGRTEKPVIEDEAFTIDQAREIAQDWIVNNASTYVFDGFNLELKEQEQVIENETYLFTFSFQSRAAGYGDRTDQMLAQMITDHVIEIVVDQGEVILAQTDNVFDEINNQMISQDDLETIDLKVYFVQVIDNQEQLVEVERTVPYTVALARTALIELIKGPSNQEKEQGFSTMINEQTQLQRIEIIDKVVYVDFSQELQENVAGSAWVTMIREQIEKTLVQFDTIDQVVISINDQTEDILQP